MIKGRKLFSKGFTLVELLVVVAIIGLLASIVFVSLGSSRGDARNARRKADLRQVKTALELCYSDASCGGGTDLYPTLGSGSAFPAMTPYLTQAPIDPRSDMDYAWITNVGDTQSFCVYTEKLENITPDTFFVISNGGLGETTTVKPLAASGCPL